MKLRPALRPVIRFRIGDGADTFLWLDHWHPLGPLCDRTSERTRCVTGLPLDARVKDIITNGDWCWPNQFDTEVADIAEHMPPYPPDISRKDLALWSPDPSGSFTTKSAYSIFHPPSGVAVWPCLVWTPLFIPAHAFILWLAIRLRLNTLDRISQYLHISPICVLCSNDRENHSHLFFNCPFSSAVWRLMRSRAGLSWPYPQWSSNVLWAANRWKGKCLKASSFRLTLAASVYFIWRERNHRIFKNTSCTASQLAHQITAAVRGKMESSHFYAARSDRSVLNRWSIPLAALNADSIP